MEPREPAPMAPREPAWEGQGCGWGPPQGLLPHRTDAGQPPHRWPPQGAVPNQPPIRLRPLVREDLPWVLARAVATGWEQLPPPERLRIPPAAVAGPVRAMVLGALSRPGAGGLVAEAPTAPGDPRIGYILYTVLAEELTGLPVGFFLDIWVDPAWRRQGVARHLCHGAEAVLRALGLREVKRSVAAHNHASLALSLQDGARVERLLLTKPL